MKKRIFKFFIIHLYIGSFVALGFLLNWGWEYYHLPLKERPHAELHLLLKPGGLWGHGYGVIGSGMLLLLFLYSVRKRNLFGIRFGQIRKWLNIHIFFGIMGPLLITLHTAGKFHGLISISYYSMLAVVLSGFIGRYIYIQIPRDEEGHELAIGEVEERLQGITHMLIEEYRIPKSTIEKINNITESRFSSQIKGISAFGTIIADDLSRPFRFIKLKRFISRHSPDMPPKAIHRIIRLSKAKALLYRRKIFLGTVSNFFHYWHVIHKPFAWVMIIIMLVHVTVTILMGYKWVF
ncbi:hypothetical protein ACFLQG_00025 [Candidatus Zixiibacteriota bacterium]